MPQPRWTNVAALALVVALASTGCSGSSSGGASGTTTSSSTSKPDCTGRGVPRGAATSAAKPIVEHLAFGGVQREYQVALPKAYDGSQAVPLVLQFHGFSSSRQAIDADTGLSREGAAAGFAVVTPDALGDPMQWNMFGAAGQADDFGFVAALVKRLRSDLCIDADRVFAAGHSNGSAFTGFLPCHVHDTFAGIAMVSATIPPICATDEQPSIWATAGTKDPQVPAKGGTVSGSTTGIPPAEESIAAYRKAYGCDPKPERSEPVAGASVETATGCTDHEQVVYVEIAGGTHPWPGGLAAAAEQADSKAGKTCDATAAILAFFAKA